MATKERDYMRGYRISSRGTGSGREYEALDAAVEQAIQNLTRPLTKSSPPLRSRDDVLPVEYRGAVYLGTDDLGCPIPGNEEVWEDVWVVWTADGSSHMRIARQFRAPAPVSEHDNG